MPQKGKTFLNETQNCFAPELLPSFYLIRYQSSFFYLCEVTKLSKSAFCFFEQNIRKQKMKNMPNCILPSVIRSQFFSTNLLIFFQEGLTSHFFILMHLCSFKKLQTDPCFRNLFAEIGKNWMFVWFISVVKPKLFQKYQLEVFHQTLKLQDTLQNFTTKKSYCGILNAVADGSNLLKMKNLLVFSQNPKTMLDLIHQDLNQLHFDMFKIIR